MISLKKNVKDFHPVNLKQVSNQLDKNKQNLIIDFKKNKSIWAIFNSDDEEKLINISPGNFVQLKENNEKNQPQKIQNNNKQKNM